MLNRWLKSLKAIVGARALLVLGIAGTAAGVQAVGYNAETYEVYYGDFNNDGKDGDVYYHRKDAFVIIHGDIAIPLQIANNGSYVVYKDTETPVSLELATSALGSYSKGVLNDDYHFTDTDNDGDIDIIATDKGGASKSITLAYGGTTPTVIVSEQTPESIVTPTLPSTAVASLVTDDEKHNIDTLQSLGGSFRVDESGAATYSIPIAVPAGTAGVAPEISLNYSSMAGNGIAGLGWSLSGISGISRCRQTLAQDGGAKPISWSSEDRFCLNGSRLIVVNGIYGAVGSQYRTEIDSGVLVQAIGGSAGHPDYFTARAKDGSITYFGGEDTVGSELNGYSGLAEQNNRTLSWNIHEFKDSVGNKITYSYDKSSKGHVISEINYAYGAGSTAYAKVKFNYVTGDRPDPVNKYVAGYEFNSTKLLDKITTFNKVNNIFQEVHRYQLEYHSESDFSEDSLSRLERIYLCGSGVCYSDDVATKFEWGSGNIAFGYAQTVSYENSSNASIFDIKTPDINGDGRSDMVWVQVSPFGSGYSYKLYSREFISTPQYIGSSTSSSLLKSGLNLIDYNADGRTDIIFNKKLYLAEPEVGGGWKYTYVKTLDLLNPTYPVFVDVNADGLVDQLSIGSTVRYRLLERTEGVPVSSNTAYDFGETKFISIPGSSSVIGKNASMGDFNGDGRMDLAVNRRVIDAQRRVLNPGAIWNDVSGYDDEDYSDVYDYTDKISIFVRTADGYELYDEIVYASFNHVYANAGEGVYSIAPSFKLQPSIDVNSDGLSDLVVSDKNSNNWQYAINTGNGFLTRESLDLITVDGDRNLSPDWVDLNYDGYVDIVWYPHTDTITTNARYKLWNPSNNAFDETKVLNGAGMYDALKVFDYNGDGRLDIVQFDSDNRNINVKRGKSDRNGTQANKIYSITDAQGNETEIQYAPLNFNGDIDLTYEVNESHYSSLEELKITGELAKECATYNAPVEGVEFDVCYDVVSPGNISDFYTAINNPFDGYEVSFTPENAAPILEIAGSTHVVTSVSSSSPYEGHADNKASVSYFYDRMRIQAAGRGALGFRKLTTVDNQTGISTVTTYRQDWPFIGMPESTITYASKDVSSDGGIILKAAYNKYDASVGNAGCAPGTCTKSKDYGPINLWVGESIETTYALENDGKAQGSAVSTVVTTMDKDSYGNVTDMVVSTHKGNESGALVKQVSTSNSYLDEGNGEGLFLGRLTQASVTTKRPGVEIPSVTRTSTFTYIGMNGNCSSGEALRGLLCTETIVGGPTTKHFYDSFGNKTFTYTRADGVGRHSAYTEYDLQGRYVEATYGLSSKAGNSSPLNNYKQGGDGYVVQTSRVNKLNRFGAVTDSDAYTGNVWLKTFHHYTDYGVPYMTAKEDGSYALSTSSTDTSFCPAIAEFSSRARVAGGGESKVCYDALGREVRSAKMGFGGKWIFSDIIYDAQGRTVKTSEPYFDGDTRYWTEVSKFDLLGRALNKTLPFFETDANGIASGTRATSRVSYDDTQGKTIYTSAVVKGLHENGLTKTEIRNVLGEIIEVIEQDNGQPVHAQYTYNVFGKLTHMRDPNGNTTDITYNALGQKQSMVDPDKGSWAYTYNKLGDLITQTDAENQKTLNCYDFAGRIVQRYDYAAGTHGTCSSPGSYIGKSTWVYDTADNGLGQLASEGSETRETAGVAGVTTRKAYEYDSYGRLSITTTTIPEDDLQPGGEHYTKVTYDKFGRVSQSFDAARSGKEFNHTATENEYNFHGYLNLVKNADENAIGESDADYYEIVAMNARGQVTEALYGGNVKTATTYYPRTGRVKEIFTTQGFKIIQSLTMHWDTVGNLASRSDKGLELDGSHRNLEEVFGYDSRNRLHSYKVGESSAITVDYNSIGNITKKSDVGNYVYNETLNALRPHAVIKAGGISYAYDDNGNVVSDTTGRTFEYTTFNKLKRVSKGTKSTNFYYDANRSRYKRIDHDTDLTHNNRSTVTLYVGGVEKVYNKDGTQQWKRTIAGGVQVTHKFVNNKFQSKDLYFMHRDHLGSTTAITTPAGELVQTMAFDPWGERRNTVNWEKAAAAQIANFFPSKKPITTRGFTGHEMVDEMGIIHMNGRIYDAKLGRFLQADPQIQAPTMIGSLNRYSYVMNNPLNAVDPSGYNWVSDRWHDTLRDVKPYVGAIVAVVLAVYAPWAKEAWGPMVIGMISGGAGAAANGGNILKGVAMGAFSGGMSFNIATAAMAGGAMARMNGGDVTSGFLSAGIGAAFGGSSGGFNGGDLIRAAVVGGVTSRITGGKFANGAAGAAFMYAVSAGVSSLQRKDEYIEVLLDADENQSESGNLRLDTPLDEFARTLPDDGPTVHSVVAHGNPDQMVLNGKWVGPEDYALHLAKTMSSETETLILYSCNVAQNPNSFAYKLHSELLSLGINVTIKAPSTYLLMHGKRADVYGPTGELKYRNKLTPGSAHHQTVVKTPNGVKDVDNAWVTIGSKK